MINSVPFFLLKTRQTRAVEDFLTPVFVSDHLSHSPAAGLYSVNEPPTSTFQFSSTSSGVNSISSAIQLAPSKVFRCFTLGSTMTCLGNGKVQKGPSLTTRVSWSC